VYAGTILTYACTSDVPGTSVAALEVADSADQLMIKLTTYLTNEGVRQAYLEADTAYVYEGRGQTELKTIRVTFYTLNGVQTSILTAREGTYTLRTGAMEARGDVVVVRTDGARLTTSVLRYDQARNQVSSDRPYVYDGPDRHVEGESFVSDPSFSNITTQRPRGTGGRFTLPGQ
jgi:LPS export ABC transporter protein LptC